MAQDQVANAAINIETFHARIHEKTARHFSFVYSAVPNNATRDTLIIPYGAAHMRPLVNAGGSAILELFEVSSYTDGTSFAPTHRNRYGSNASSVAFHTTASVNVVAETIFRDIAGEPKRSGPGGGQGSFEEFVLRAGINYALRLTNVSGGAAYYAVIFDFYEPGNPG